MSTATDTPAAEAGAEIARSEVRSGEVTIAVEERGDPSATSIVLVHGYPDTQAMWRLVAERLADRFHVVTYDVRGAGDSTAPAGWAGYSFRHLIEDAGEVIRAVAPGKRVHLVGHDWGAIQGWEVLADDATGERIASFTSISGPPLDHMGDWVRRRLRHPTLKGLAQLGGQLRRSWYLLPISVPGVPERMWRRVGARRWPEVLSRIEHARVDASFPAPTLATDGGQGAGLYRRNMAPHLTRRKRRAPIETPVQIITPSGDRFVSPHAHEGLEERIPNITHRRVAGGHWAPRTHPDLVAGWVAGFVDDVESGTAPRTRRPFDTGGARPLAGQVALVTGAGSGIGRATAQSLARAGAELIAVDINLDSARATAELLAAHGGSVEAARADVGDLDSMQALADSVAAEHGAVDILVNNAGIGVAGPFLDTTVDDWERVLEVNLWGVIHGCRLFGRQMVERGQGGQIVNIASMSAFQPSKETSAYSTSKAAVLMLSECLRADLAGYGIGVCAICPGFIATPITRAAHFVGRSDEEQAELRRRVTTLYARRNFSPDRVGEEILEAVLRNDAVRSVAPEAKLIRGLSRLSPGLLRALARVDAIPG